MNLAIETRVKNGLLYKAVQKLGSQKALADYLDTDNTTISEWLNFKSVPKFRKPRKDLVKHYEELDTKLIMLIGYGLEEIFPKEVDKLIGMENKIVREEDIPVHI